MADRQKLDINLPSVPSTTDAKTTVERIGYLTELMAIAIEDISALQEETEAYRNNAIAIMAEALDQAGFRVIHDRDIDSIALLANPVIYQQAAESSYESGGSITEGFEEWSDMLDKVTPEAIKRTKQIINERY